MYFPRTKSPYVSECYSLLVLLYLANSERKVAGCLTKFFDIVSWKITQHLSITCTCNRRLCSMTSIRKALLYGKPRATPNPCFIYNSCKFFCQNYDCYNECKSLSDLIKYQKFLFLEIFSVHVHYIFFFTDKISSLTGE